MSPTNEESEVIGHYLVPAHGRPAQPLLHESTALFQDVISDKLVAVENAVESDVAKLNQFFLVLNWGSDAKGSSSPDGQENADAAAATAAASKASVMVKQRTLLMIAAHAGSLRVLSYLLAKGAEPGRKAPDGITAYEVIVEDILNTNAMPFYWERPLAASGPQLMQGFPNAEHVQAYRSTLISHSREHREFSPEHISLRRLPGPLGTHMECQSVPYIMSQVHRKLLCMSGSQYLCRGCLLACRSRNIVTFRVSVPYLTDGPCGRDITSAHCSRHDARRRFPPLVQHAQFVDDGDSQLQRDRCRYAGKLSGRYSQLCYVTSNCAVNPRHCAHICIAKGMGGLGPCPTS